MRAIKAGTQNQSMESIDRSVDRPVDRGARVSSNMDFCSCCARIGHCAAAAVPAKPRVRRRVPSSAAIILAR